MVYRVLGPCEKLYLPGTLRYLIWGGEIWLCLRKHATFRKVSLNGSRLRNLTWISKINFLENLPGKSRDGRIDIFPG